MKKINQISILTFLLCMILTSGTASAVVVRDENSGWEFETTQPEAKRDVYGSISGISNLSTGDSVGVFDKNGSCYGIGKYNGVYYFISLFGEDAGSKGIDYTEIDDYSIPGFKNGDEVVFKVYTNVDGKVYTLKTSDNQPLIFASVSGPNPNYPSRKVDLAYKAEDTTPTTPPPVTPPTGGTTPQDTDTATGGGGSVILGHYAPVQEKEKTAPLTTAVITEPKKEERAAKEPYYAQILEKEPVDYYSEPAHVPGTPQRFVGGGLEEGALLGTPFYEPEKEEGKKLEAAKAREPEIAKKKRSRLLLNLLLLLLLLLILMLTLWRALKKEEEVYYNEDKESEDSGLRR